MARVGILLLGSGSTFVIGIILIAFGFTLQAGATGAVKAIKMSAKLVAGNVPATPPPQEAVVAPAAVSTGERRVIRSTLHGALASERAPVCVGAELHERSRARRVGICLTSGNPFVAIRRKVTVRQTSDYSTAASDRAPTALRPRSDRAPDRVPAGIALAGLCLRPEIRRSQPGARVSERATQSSISQRAMLIGPGGREGHPGQNHRASAISRASQLISPPA